MFNFFLPALKKTSSKRAGVWKMKYFSIDRQFFTYSSIQIHISSACPYAAAEINSRLLRHFIVLIQRQKTENLNNSINKTKLKPVTSQNPVVHMYVSVYWCKGINGVVQLFAFFFGLSSVLKFYVINKKWGRGLIIRINKTKLVWTDEDVVQMVCFLDFISCFWTNCWPRCNRVRGICQIKQEYWYIKNSSIFIKQ